MNAIVLFCSTFLLVLFLGLQQLNVSGGHRMLAVMTSIGISCANLVVLKCVPGPTSVLDLMGYVLGGPLGILCSMALHPHLVRVFRRVAS